MIYTMILDGSYPQDIRVRKEAESLAENGIPVQVITRWQKGEKRKEEVNGVTVYRLGMNYTHSTKGINDMFTALFFIDVLFLFNLLKFFRSNKVGTLHVHDLALLSTILVLKGKRQVVLDMHENYPEMLEELKFSSKGFLKGLKDKLFFGYKRWKRYESRVIRKPDHIVAVIDEMKEKLIKEYNIPSSKITVISNYEKLDFTAQSEMDDFHFNPEVVYVAYVGGISPVRGLETVIDAITLLRSQNENVEFVIVGGGNASYVNSLQERASKSGFESAFHFMGYRNFKKINYYISNVQVNVIPHVKNEHTDHTIPHKLFQIMLQKAPLLVSNCEPMKRILLEKNAGYVFEAGNVDSCAQRIREMAVGNEVKERVQRAFELAQSKYNWDLESQKLVKLVRSYAG